MKKRLFGQNAGDHATRSLRARVADERLPTHVAANSASKVLPFSQLMKRDWAEGKLSSRDVQEYCAGAALESNYSEDVRAFTNVAASILFG